MPLLIISKEGLLITNHHCGYSQIQQHSTVEKDYLTEGYWAKSKAEESTVRTIIRFEDHEKFETVGVDSNMFQSALEAVSKGLRYYLNKRYNSK